MATILERIAKGEIISRERSAQMLRLLSRNFWDRVSISQIPSDVFIASKNGAVNESRSEVLYIRGREANYVFCICTKNIADQSWKEENEAWTMTRKISKLLWEYFE
jgi:beta-lactamase class A